MRPRSHQCDDRYVRVRGVRMRYCFSPVARGEAKYAAYACRVLLIRLLLAWFHAIVGRPLSLESGMGVGSGMGVSLSHSHATKLHAGAAFGV